MNCYECGCELDDYDAMEIIDDEYGICEDCYDEDKHYA